MLNQEKIHRYFNHLTGAKRIEFLYALLHLCQPLELRYLGTCLEEIARKDYEHLYHAEQKTNHLTTPIVSSTLTNSNSTEQEENPSLIDPNLDEKLDLTDQIARAYTIVDIALLWAKNRPCAIRIFRRLKATESVKLVDMLLERDDLDERTMDEILVIFCLAANHPAFSFDMRTQMSQILKELEKRQRKMKLLRTVQNLDEVEDENLDESGSIPHSNTLSVHASPLLTRLALVNTDVESSPMRILIRADWSDNNSTLVWKTPNDIRSFHLQLSNVVYHDDLRLERLMNISGYLRDIGSANESDVELMKKNIGIYIAHLVYFSSYISTISTLAKFFNSSLKLVDLKQRLLNSNGTYEESYSSPSSPSLYNGSTPLQCELSIPPSYDSDSRSLNSPKFVSNGNKSKQQTDVAKQARSLLSMHHSTQTGFEVRCEETQTDRMPGPGFILAEHQDYLRRYSMEQLANLTPNELIADGLDSHTAQLLCGALDDLKPMSVHLSNGNKSVRSPSSVVHIPIVSTSPAGPLDSTMITYVPSTSRSSPPPPGFDRNSMDNYSSHRPSLSSSPGSSKVPKTNINTSTNSMPQAIPTQHHLPLLNTHSFLYNPLESCIVPIALPPGLPIASPDFMRLFAPNMMMSAMPNLSYNTINPSAQNYSQNAPNNVRSTNPTNGTNTPPEPNPHHSTNGHTNGSTTSSNVSRHPTNHQRHRHHPLLDSNVCPPTSNGNLSQQQTNRTSYSQYHRHKACYTCGDFGHLAFACPEQYLSDSNYSHSTRGKTMSTKENDRNSISDGYQLDYRPRQSTPTNQHQHQHQHQQRQMRSNSNSKAKIRENS